MCQVKGTACNCAGDPFLRVETGKSTNQQSMRSPRIIWYSVRFGPKWAQTSYPLFFFFFFGFCFFSILQSVTVYLDIILQYGRSIQNLGILQYN